MSKDFLRPPRVLRPAPPTGMVIEGALYIPSNLTKQNKSAFLRHAGIGGAAAAFSQLFGELRAPSETLKLLAGYRSDSLICAISRLAHRMAVEGVKTIGSDALEDSLLSVAFAEAFKQGYKPMTNIAIEDISNIALFGPETINSLLAVALANYDEDQNKEFLIGENAGKFGLATLMLNDFVFGERPEDERVIARERMLRQIYYAGPQLGTLNTFLSRLHRFVSIYRMMRQNLSESQLEDIDACLTEEVGLPFEEFIPMILPLSHVWYSGRDFTKDPLINLKSTTNPTTLTKLRAILSKISLVPATYSEGMKKIYSESGQGFFRNTATLIFLTRYPFLDLGNDVYLLLAPHLFMRRIELCVKRAISERRDKKVFNLSAALGRSFETYLQTVISKITDPGPLGTQTWEPGGKSKEICEAVIQDPNAYIFIEAKYKSPPPAALNLDEPTTGALSQWLYETFLISPENAKIRSVQLKKKIRRGALWQLSDGIQRVLAGELGRVPNVAVPVVVIPDDLPTLLPLYSVLDKGVAARKRLFADSRCSPFLILTISDLEILSRIDRKASPPIQTLIRDKALDSDNRLMSCHNYLKLRGVKLLEKEDELRTLNDLIRAFGKAVGELPKDGEDLT